MKNISELLNLLASAPSDGSSLLKGGPVSGKGSQSNGNSFGDILTQLSNQQDNSNANQPNNQAPQTGNPGTTNPSAVNSGAALVGNAASTSSAPVPTESFVSLSETVISVTESIQVSSPSQLAQAEQSLASLAAGLSKLLNLFSNLQGMDAQQAQNAIVSLGGGQITPADAMGLLNTIQQITQKDAGQNPLLMTPDQQNNLLSQAFQQMFQNQQLALGTFANLGPTSSDSAQINNVVLQMTFSDTNITAIQQTGSQSSQVFIDLENFQMSATFFQAGTGMVPGQGTAQSSLPSFQPLPAAMADPLLASFNQALLNLAGQSSSTATGQVLGPVQAAVPPQVSTNQTFQNLVQLLVQSGASQAVLSSYMNQANAPAANGPDQTQVQNTALDNFLNSVTLLSQNPSLGPAYGMGQSPALALGAGAQESAIVAGTASLLMENISQTSILMDSQTVQAGDQVAVPQMAASIQMSALSVSVFDFQAQGVVASPLDMGTLNNLNAAVARFNTAVVQAGQTPEPNPQAQSATVSVEQILINLESIQSAGNPTASSKALPVVVDQAVNVFTQQTMDLNLTVASLAVTAGVSPSKGMNNISSSIGLQQGSSSIGVSVDSTLPGGGVSQISVQEALSPNGINVQLQVSNGAAVTDQPVDNPAAGISTSLSAQISTAPIVSASVFAGETVKNTVQVQTPSNNNDLATPPAVLSGLPASEVKPIVADAVLAVPSANQAGVSLSLVGNSQDGTAATVSQIDSNLIISGMAPAPDKGQGANSSSNPTSVNIANGSINSAQILNQITDQIAAQAANARSVSRLSFQLVPESLGRVTIQIALVDQTVSARIFVSNPDVRDAIQHHMVDLKAALSQSGLQIDQLQVQVQGGGANLLAQYYQYQQEGSGYRLPVGAAASNLTDMNSLENTDDLANLSVRLSLVNVLA